MGGSPDGGAKATAAGPGSAARTGPPLGARALGDSVCVCVRAPWGTLCVCVLCVYVLGQENVAP